MTTHKPKRREETKLQELERRILALEKDKTIVISYPPIQIYPPNGGAGGTQPQCNCNLLYNTPTRPPCPFHGNNYPHFPVTTC